MAYEQGLFSQRHISPIQRWALGHLLVQEKKIKNEEEAQWWKQYTMITNPAAYTSLYNPQALAMEDMEDGSETVITSDGSGEEGWGMDNTDDIDAFLKTLGTTHTISDNRLGKDEGWI